MKGKEGKKSEAEGGETEAKESDKNIGEKVHPGGRKGELWIASLNVPKDLHHSQITQQLLELSSCSLPLGNAED